jgi:hypothetical protein
LIHRDVVEGAIQMFKDNNDISDHVRDTLLAHPETSIRTLLSAAALLQLRVDHRDVEKKALAAKGARLEEECQRLRTWAQVAEAYIAKTHALNDEVQALLAPLRAVADHAKFCTAVTTCDGHDSILQVASALHQHLNRTVMQ